LIAQITKAICDDFQSPNIKPNRFVIVLAVEVNCETLPSWCLCRS